RKRAPEAGEVRRTEPFLHRPVENADVVELLGEAIGELTGAVGRVVVDDEDVHALVAERAQHRVEVLALVVRGGADSGSRHPPIFNVCRKRCPGTWTSRTSSTCWRTCWRSRARRPFECSPTAKPRRASAKRPAPSPSSR